jgi:hypothetical protein
MATAAAPESTTPATAPPPPPCRSVTRRISNCSTGRRSTLNTRKWTVSRALTGSKAAAPSALPPMTCSA